ncbi:MAG: SDR family oxidoreductase [Acidobacteria bacterium]|nr:SDR family oxidoreductase [Acidobacteriota bacterium]
MSYLVADLRGRVALVTGASSGIGQAAAVELGRNGATVIIGFRKNEKGAQETLERVQQAGGSGVLGRADVSEASAVTELFSLCQNRHGRVDILVNNAADPVAHAEFEDWTVDMFDRVMAINFRSVLLCCQSALRLMKPARYGRIINVSSIGAIAGGSPWTLPYAATKGAVETFTRGLARAVGRYGITVNAVSPGSIDTPMQHAFANPDYIGQMAAETAVGRVGKPQDVAGLILYLASEASSFITGQVFRVDGGRKY